MKNNNKKIRKLLIRKINKNKINKKIIFYKKLMF